MGVRIGCGVKARHAEEIFIEVMGAVDVSGEGGDVVQETKAHAR